MIDTITTIARKALIAVDSKEINNNQ